MRKIKLTRSIALAGVLAVALATAAYAAGFLTNGLPGAGGAQFPSTFPLTGLESIPADTNIAAGAPPQSEDITVAQLSQGSFVSANNATSFTATAAQVSGSWHGNLLLTGAPATAQTLTLPTVASVVQNIQTNAPGIANGFSYLLHIVNVGGTASGAWTVATATGWTLTGNLTVPVAGSRTFLVTITSVASNTATMQDLGN